MNFKERKAERAAYYHNFVFGWRLQKCTACAGSGHYDTFKSPRCDSCNGSGKELYKHVPKVSSQDDIGSTKKSSKCSFKSNNICGKPGPCLFPYCNS